MEIQENEGKVFALDHHGIVATVCRDLGIAEKIDQRIGSLDPRRKVSPGKASVAMILNGLGFTNRRLYLIPQFFENKPVDRLISPGLVAQDLNDHTLGKALDEIAEYGTSKLFAEMAFEIADEQKIWGHLARLDTTSFSLEGEYKNEILESELGSQTVIQVTKGFSKDHRPDLKQVILSLAMTGPSFPFWMEPLDGNQSDKKSFHETIQRVQTFQEQLKQAPAFERWIADSALYTKDRLLSQQTSYLWISRVPETIGEAVEWLEKSDDELRFQNIPGKKGYSYVEVRSQHGGCEQRWIIISSLQAFQRESKTFNKNLLKKEKELKKQINHLGRQIFSCAEDAQKELKKLQKKHPLFELQAETQEIKKYTRAGRPKEFGTQQESQIFYQIQISMKRNEQAILRALRRKGRFILATNDLRKEKFSGPQIFEEYKGLSEVESGFRFLKDPWFMVDSFFVKTPARIEALMMIMVLCLMVYNLAQHQLREALKKENQTIPNQLGKPIQTPTIRWIFQMMEGIYVVHFYLDQLQAKSQQMIMNLNDVRKRIIRCFGDTACQIYGIT